MRLIEIELIIPQAEAGRQIKFLANRHPGPRSDVQILYQQIGACRIDLQNLYKLSTDKNDLSARGPTTGIAACAGRKLTDTCPFTNDLPVRAQ